MTIEKILIANRGEIAIRIARAASELGIQTVAICSVDDRLSLHTKAADKVLQLNQKGVAAYLDMEAIIEAARNEGCQAIHPGYGFLSENVAFARRLADENIIFIGPDVELLSLFGNKLAARDHARRLGIPLLPGTSGPTSLEEAASFLKGLGPGGAIMIKAVAGGGGRGMRPVLNHDELIAAANQRHSMLSVTAICLWKSWFPAPGISKFKSSETGKRLFLWGSVTARCSAAIRNLSRLPPVPR